MWLVDILTMVSLTFLVKNLPYRSVVSCAKAYGTGVRGGGQLTPPPIRADTTFIRAKDNTFV